MRQSKEQLFWTLSEPMLADPSVSRSTMMGFPCLRLDGRFFASIDRDSKDLVIKLPARRVDVLVASGQGMVFAPNHRVFREWVAVPTLDRQVWAALLDEAKTFAADSGSGSGRSSA
ncbi:MAG: hypothetical protein A2Z32_13975 [Chloroflexi bacterium RBG_16_69_14]|nr:MAG: hypothetical protein A2Z32_13975 [Chloroflexi bacterium RBG_16_69_14]